MLQKKVLFKITTIMLSITLLLGAMPALITKAENKRNITIGLSEELQGFYEDLKDTSIEESPFTAEQVIKLLEEAQKDGTAVAQLVNSYTDDTSFYAALRTVLNLYFGESFPEQREAFLNAIDNRASEIIKNYLTAEVERLKGVTAGFVPGEVLLTLQNATNKISTDKLFVALGFLASEADVVSVSDVDSTTVYRIDIPLEYTVEHVVEEFSKHPAIQQIQPNFVYKRFDSPVANDTYAEDTYQWYLNKINLKPAWDIMDMYSGNPKVRVAIIDGAVELNHPDLAANLNTALAIDLVDPANPKPISSVDDHGTGVAGIIGAVSNNNIGVAGIASGRNNQGVELLSINIFAGNTATSASLVAGIDYAIANDAKVINLSIGGPATGAPGDMLEADAVARAHQAGATVVVSAGNDSSDTLVVTPADTTDAINVIAIKNYATTAENPRVPASNYGFGKDISAPGAQLTTTASGRGYMHGFGNTSGATSVVTGVVAMLYYIEPNLTVTEVREILTSTAIDLHTSGKDDQTAWGMVNAGAAVARVHQPMAAIALNTTSQNLVAGQTTTLSVVSYAPANTTVDKTATWVSSNPAVARVDSNGLVTAARAGNATITCTVAGISENCLITVSGGSSGSSSSGGSSSGGSGGSGGGGISAGGSTALPAKPTERILTKTEATKLFTSDLLKKAKDATSLSFKAINYTSVDKSTLAELATLAKKNKVTLTVNFDQVEGGKLTSRISINPELHTSDLKLNLPSSSAQTEKTKKFFEKYFKNNTIVVSTGQDTAFNQSVSVIVAVPKDFSTTNLVFYSYNSKTNKYVKIQQPNAWVDASNFVHFETTQGGSYIISDGPLVTK